MALEKNGGQSEMAKHRNRTEATNDSHEFRFVFKLLHCKNVVYMNKFHYDNISFFLSISGQTIKKNVRLLSIATNL